MFGQSDGKASGAVQGQELMYEMETLLPRAPLFLALSLAFRIQAFFYIYTYSIFFQGFLGYPVSAKVFTKVLCDPLLIHSIPDVTVFLSSPFSIMASEQYSLNLDLHRAALNGNVEAVRSALREGANINALDAAGRTTIMSAVAGEQYVSFILFTSILPHN